METARARRPRRKNLSLRHQSLARGRHSKFDAAYETFYREHVAEVYHYALAVLGNPADAEDVTQQTFLNAYRAFQRGERPHKPHNWLIKIAHNVCRMRWRQSSRRPQEVPLDNVAEPVALDDEKPSLDEVLGALARLPFNQRAAIVMREVEDRSYAEIAEVLDTTVPAVEALLFRARTSLRARRKALAGALTIVPVPGSLSSFFGGGGGLIAAGGAAVGSELALKVAAIVATGVVAGGLGYKTVDAVATADPHRPAAAKPRSHPEISSSPLPRLSTARSRPDTKAFRHPARPRASKILLRAPSTAELSDTTLVEPPSPAEAPVAAPAAPEAATAGVTASAASATSATSAATTTAAGVVSSLPLPAAPSTPPAVTTPVLPVTVTLPAVPIPPGVK
jgi:RNA polymerase sigma factor (sigma-70 family)